MSLIVLEQASLSFGERVLLDEVNLRIGEGESIGLVGPNGAGKSTLLRVMLGVQGLDGGSVRTANDCCIGYLPQDVLELAGETILRAVLDTVPGRGDIEERLARLEQRLAETAEPDEQMALARRLADLNDQLEHFERHYSERRARTILAGLGFDDAALDRPTAELSGGWKMRAALAGLLFQQPDVLFLDEPTNHLDLPSVHWLDGFLAEYRKAVLLICHDRDFLNRHAQRIISFEPEGVRSYRGNFDSYLEQRAAEEEVLAASQRNRERELKELERFVERFKAKATKARQAQSRARRIKRLQRELADEKRPVATKTLSFSFPPVGRTGKDVLQLERVAKSFGPLQLYRQLSRGVFAGDRIAIVGANGVGKTTLLKIMAGELAADSGQIRYGANVEVGYYAQHHTELLSAQRTVLDEVRRVVPQASESFVRGVCGAFLFSGDDVDKAVGVLSGGERARVLLARLLVNPGNLLLMDEPTNHLDLHSSEALADALQSFDGTLVFVSHNTSFINRLATKVWDIVDGDVVEYPGRLSEYLEHLRQRDAAQTAQPPAPQPEEQARPRPAQKRQRGEQTRRSRQERKRREAARRNALSRRTRGLREEIEKLEQRIAALEEEQAQVEPRLAAPETYQDSRVFQELLSCYNTNREKIEELYGRWEYRQQQLEQAVAEVEGPAGAAGSLAGDER